MAKSDEGYVMYGDGLWAVEGGTAFDLSTRQASFPVLGRPNRDLVIARLRYALEQLEGQVQADRLANPAVGKIPRVGGMAT